MEAQEVYSESFVFKLSTAKNGIQLFDEPLDLDSFLNPNLSLLSVHNGSKKFAASNGTSIVIDNLSKLNHPETFDRVSGLSNVSQVSFSLDGSKLFVLMDNVLHTMDPSSTSHPEKYPATGDYSIISFQTAPGGLAALTENGDLLLLQGTLVAHTIPQIAYFQYSLDGSKVYCISSKKVIVIESGVEVLSIPPPEDVGGTPLAIAEVSPSSWIIVYDVGEDPEDHEFDTYIVTKEDNYIYRKTFLADPLNFVPRTTTYYFQPLLNWAPQTLVFVTSSLATDLSTVSVEDEPVVLIPDIDTNQPAFPINDDTGDDASAVGFALDLSNTDYSVSEPCMGVDEAKGLPKALVLSHDGYLIGWWVIESALLKTGKLDLNKATQTNGTPVNPLEKIEIKPQEKTETNIEPNPFGLAKPFESSFGSSFGSSAPTPAANTTTTLGQTSFGKPQQTAAGFGQTSFSQMGNSGSPFGGAALSKSTTSGGFGKYAEKQASSPFGTAAGGKSIFGDSNTASPFGQTNSGKSIFGSDSKPSPFGQTNSGKSIFGDSNDRPSPFGQTNTSGSIFDSKSSPLGQVNNTKSIFGDSSSPFGQKSTEKPKLDSQAKFGAVEQDSDEESDSSEESEDVEPSSQGQPLDFSKFSIGKSGPAQPFAKLEEKPSPFGQLGKPEEKSPFAKFGEKKGESPFANIGEKKESPFAKFGSEPKGESPFAKFGNQEKPDEKKESSPFAKFSSQEKVEKKESSPFAQFGKQNESTSTNTIPEKTESPFAKLSDSKPSPFAKFGATNEPSPFAKFGQKESTPEIESAPSNQNVNNSVKEAPFAITPAQTTDGKNDVSKPLPTLPQKEATDTVEPEESLSEEAVEINPSGSVQSALSYDSDEFDKFDSKNIDLKTPQKAEAETPDDESFVEFDNIEDLLMNDKPPAPPAYLLYDGLTLESQPKSSQEVLIKICQETDARLSVLQSNLSLFKQQIESHDNSDVDYGLDALEYGDLWKLCGSESLTVLASSIHKDLSILLSLQNKSYQGLSELKTDIEKKLDTNFIINALLEQAKLAKESSLNLKHKSLDVHQVALQTSLRRKLYQVEESIETVQKHLLSWKSTTFTGDVKIADNIGKVIHALHGKIAGTTDRISELSEQLNSLKVGLDKLIQNTDEDDELSDYTPEPSIEIRSAKTRTIQIIT